MKLFYFIDSLQVGGSETQAVQTAIRMAARGHRLVFACLQKTGPLLRQLEERGIPVLEFPPGKSLFSLTAAWQIWRLSRYLRRERFDVVHAHDLYSDLMGIPAARLAGIPRVIAAQRDLGEWWWYTPRNRRILRFLQRHACRVIANSGAIRDRMVHEGFPEAQIVVLRNGVDTERFGEARCGPAPLWPGWTGAEFLAIAVSNMHEESKGQQFLIEAVAALRERFPALHLALAGDGPRRTHLERLAERSGIGDRVHFLGRRADIPELLACSDAGVLPSLTEGLPNSVLEYLAAGLPVVATRVGGVPEVIEDGQEGFLVPPGNPGALAAALSRLLQDPGLAQRMGDAGQRRAQAEFSFERLVERLEGLYSQGFLQR
jgi:glycosyltransferase involved in cell wall biosynthesis